ncbi:hypothetical protein DYL61_29290 [Pseudomonas nabeulensis]|uniref:Uncharacterized protein n=1 Tax=Pseudomonas nabeulensis TaxID=2293833 RepID=A0A4Z0AHE0_9PSED|nr:hypothetical protein DYL61_29290 [Pseudomonas nabeulensis]
MVWANLLWRGSLLPLGCAAAPTKAPRFFRQIPIADVVAASQPSGSKLPRHNKLPHFKELP